MVNLGAQLRAVRALMTFRRTIQYNINGIDEGVPDMWFSSQTGTHDRTCDERILLTGVGERIFCGY